MKITVKIGAALDGDLQKILYEPMVAGAARARQRVRSEMTATFNETAARAKEALKVETAARIIEDRRRAQSSLAIQKSGLASERQLKAQEHAHDLAMARDAARQKVREDEKAARESAKVKREAIRQEAKDRKEAEGAVRSFAGGVAGTARGLVSRGVGVAADVARGAGVSFDIASGVKKRVDLQAAATALSNAGYQEDGVGITGVRQDPRAIMADIQKTGESYGIDQMDIAGALDKFVGKTGELQTGREMLDSFAKTAKATGASMEDVAAAAGAISNKLGDVPDKANAINKVMLAIAGQGKVGAVEIKDLATQMEKLTSQASKFQSNAALKGLVGNDTGANIAMLGVLAQAARKTEKGSAAQATQSAMAFVRDLTSQTATKRILSQNQIGLYTDKDKTQLRDPQEIIKDIISKTKGDQTKLSYMMSNQNSRAVVNAFMDPYLAAYKGTKGSAKEKDEAGRAAVDAAFKTLKDATLSDKAQQEAVNAALGTTGSKVEQFQQKLDAVIGNMADRVIPALVRFSDPAIKAADGLSRLAVWSAEHPMGAAGGVVAASIAKSAADTVASKAAGALVGGLTGGLGFAAVTTLAIASVGMMAIDHVTKNMDDKNKKQFADEAEALNNRLALKHAQERYDAEVQSGAPTAETAAELDKAKAAVTARKDELERRIAEGGQAQQKVDNTGFHARAFNDVMDFMKIGWHVGGGGSTHDLVKANESKLDLEALQAELSDVKKAMDGVSKALGEGIAIKSLPAGVPALGGATTGTGGG